MKGISTTLVIIITLVVLLAVAVVVLTFFGVNIGNVGNLLSEWLGFARSAPTFDCEKADIAAGKCTLFSGCLICPSDGGPDTGKCKRIGSCTPKTT